MISLRAVKFSCFLVRRFSLHLEHRFQSTSYIVPVGTVAVVVILYRMYSARACQGSHYCGQSEFTCEYFI